MTYSDEVLEFWEKVKQETGIKGDFYDAWGFGSSPEVMDELLGLILGGKKRTTTTLVMEMEIEDYPPPVEGEYNIILDGKDKPKAVIQTVSVSRAKFNEVTDEHAFWEGEGETTRELFIQHHGEYYRKEGKRLGFEFHEEMEALFERFELVYPTTK